MESVKKIKIPVIADSVLSPDFLYSDYTGIYFVTDDDEHGRITFENLDAVKICRGEILPYPFDSNAYERGVWIYQIENSKWQNERFAYEKKHYGNAYEFGGNVNDMQTDFKHYLFKFHDEFIEVIARGFWFEQSDTCLFKKELQKGHPFLPLPLENIQTIKTHTLTSQIRSNPLPKEELKHNAQFCSQTIFEFALELEGKASINHTVLLSYKDEKLISTLRDYFGKAIACFEGVATLEQVTPYIEKYMGEVYERRKAMGLQ